MAQLKMNFLLDLSYGDHHHNIHNIIVLVQKVRYIYIYMYTVNKYLYIYDA